jgi:hypothetical protein
VSAASDLASEAPIAFGRSSLRCRVNRDAGIRLHGRLGSVVSARLRLDSGAATTHGTPNESDTGHDKHSEHAVTRHRSTVAPGADAPAVALADGRCDGALARSSRESRYQALTTWLGRAVTP